MDCAVASATIPCLCTCHTDLMETGRGCCEEQHAEAEDAVRVFVFDNTVRPECPCLLAFPEHRAYTIVAKKCTRCRGADPFTGQANEHHAKDCYRCEGGEWLNEPSPDVWRIAVVNAGASVMRTWWDRTNECWWADVRLIEVHLESSIVKAETPMVALFEAIERATEKIPGVRL